MAKKTQENWKIDFALPAGNYKLLLIGFVVIVLGFALMVHAPNEVQESFDDDIYGFRCTVLAPMTVLAGFVFEIYAIMRRAKKEDKQ